VGSSLGAVGGDERTGTHGHGVNDPTHGHGVNDPGHLHAVRTANSASFGGGVNGGVDNYQNLDWRGETTAGAATNISIGAAATGITVQNFTGGASANMPPALICTVALFAGA
jgi:hypothetical protein